MDVFSSPAQAPLPKQDLSEYEYKELIAAREEMDKRRMEALRLYEPLPFQEAYHSCRAKECIIQKANQAGGSLAGFVEVARAVLGKDPHDKYPKRDGIAVCLGYGEKHIGRVIHRYLFRAGAFRIIQDARSNKWRTFRPWSKEQKIAGKRGDLEREKHSKPAPPLIPPRFIDGKLSWEKRAENIFSYVKFTTGWELYALNSAGEAHQAQGFQVDLYDVDEDVATPGWLEEATARTSIRKGLIRWHALPHSRTDDIMNMIQRAQDEEDANMADDQRTTVRITATMYDNPYYPEQSRRENERIWKSQGEDVYRKRALGQVVLDSVLMYPTFDKRLHSAISHDADRSKIQEFLTEHDGTPPHDWCRYLSFDPGHTVGAVLFAAVPPKSLGDYCVFYDELYLQNCEKTTFGRHLEPKVKGWCFQDFLIDAHGGRLRELGSGILPKRQYEEELEQRGIVCVERDSRFLNGSDDVKGREEKLREWLAIRPSGDTKLLVVTQRCPNFVREMERFKKKTVKVGGQDVPTDEGNRRANTHLVECAEYLAAHGCVYVKPKTPSKPTSVVKLILQGRKRRAQQRAANNYDPTRNSRSLGPRGSVSL